MGGYSKRELVIQAGMQLIPYVGGSLATLYFGAKNEKRFSRLESFYQELAVEIQNISESVTSVEQQDADALQAIIESLHEKVEVEPTHDKREFFKNYYKNTLRKPIQNNFDERKFFLDSLADMTLLECELLVFINANLKVLVGHIQKPGVDQYAILGTIGKLKTRGFLMGLQKSVSAGGNIDNSLYEMVSISTFGSSFYEFCLSA